MDFEKLVIPFGVDTKELVKGIDEASEKANGLVSKLTNIGKTAVIGAVGLATTGVAALSGAIATSIGKTSEWAGEMDGIQDILGGTKEQASGLALMMKRVGGSTDQVTGAIKKMAMGLNTLDKDGFSKTEKSLKKLGVSLKRTDGSMKDSYEIFAEVSDVVSQMPDGLEKDAILMDIFGKSGADLGDALNAAADGGMKNFQEEATKLGLAIDPQRTIDFQKAQERLNATFDGLWVTLGNKLMPAMTILLNWFTNFIQSPSVQNFITPVIDGISRAVEAFATGSEKGGIFQGFLAALASFNSPFLDWIVKGVQDCITWFENFKGAVTTDFGEGSIVQNALAILANTWEIVKTAVVKVWEVLTGQTDPAMKEMGSNTAPNMAKALGDINKGLEGFLGWLKTLTPEQWKLIAALGTFLVVGIPVTNLIIGMIGSTKNLVTAIQLLGGATNIAKLALSALGGPVGLLIGAIVLLGILWSVLGKQVSETAYQIIMIMEVLAWKLVNNVFGAIEKAIQWVIDRFHDLQRAISNLHLPSWLTPGSPTPFEIGLLGINDALKQVASTTLPEFSTQLDIQGEFLPEASASQQEAQPPLDMNIFAKVIAGELAKVIG